MPLPPWDTDISPMKTTLSFSAPAAIETEALVVVVLDGGDKDKPQVGVDSSDAAIKEAAAEVFASGEAVGKLLEITLLHNPAKLKAKKLLLLGGGKAKNFSAFDLRKLGGAAVRALKSRGVKNFAFVAPETGLKPEETVRAIIEGAFVGSFDSDTYKSDRKVQAIDSVTIVVKGDQASLQKAMDEARILGESQNFTRELVNEPSNHMTPTILAEQAQKMCQEVGLKCESTAQTRLKSENGRVLGSRPRLPTSHLR